MNETRDPSDPSISPPGAAGDPPALRVAIFDDVVAARGEQFHIPGLRVDVFPHADDAVATCAAVAADTGDSYDWVFMDFALGEGHQNGDEATGALRAAGFRGKIIAISSDPVANERMRSVGADDSLAKKAHLRSYLVHLGSQHLGQSSQHPARSAT